MFDDTPPLFAVRGDRGTDLFRRAEDSGQRRVHFDCLGMIDARGLHRFDDALDPAAAQAAADRLDGHPALLTPWALGDARGYPDAGALGLDLFVYAEFFQSLSVARLALADLAREIDTDPVRALADISALIEAVRLIHGFNLIDRAASLSDRLAAALTNRVARGALSDGDRDRCGFGLRMLGDMATRRGDAAGALAAHQGAVAAGDNPFRRGRAAQAALAAGDTQAARAHLAALAARGALPDALRPAAQSLGVT